MRVRFLLGAAGSGKTYRCLSEAREALEQAPEGLPLVLVAPRQGTYQLEQQLLATPGLAGFTRLSIRSFESLARFVFERFGRPAPPQLSDEGRVMVLRGLLVGMRSSLNVFRSSARLTGFARQLSQVLAELQHAELTPSRLRELAGTMSGTEGLGRKLQDLALLFEAYLGWLRDHGLEDGDALLTKAAELLNEEPGWGLDWLWVDGFAEFTDLELGLLSALAPRCGQLTITFCLDAAPGAQASWLSHWSTVTRSYTACRRRLAEVRGAEIVTETLRRQTTESRFGQSPVLRHLEERWAAPEPYVGGARPSLRLVGCADREAEVTLAAREIRAFVRSGARYRDISVLVRRLEPYHSVVRRVFQRYQIPFFLDQRESVAHHPLAELTRSAVRVVALGWRQEDWFAGLKSGLFPAEDEEIDLIENEALARGWSGPAWLRPVQLKDVPRSDGEREHLVRLEQRLESIRRAVAGPMEKFMTALAGGGNRPTGPQLAGALRGLWSSLRVEEQLTTLSEGGTQDGDGRARASVHETVWTQMNAWLDNAELAFPREPLALRDWVPILEAGLASLTVGIIPPALDQVLVGAVDRSRTPEVKMVLVLGLNESVFPAQPDPGVLLTDSDRTELEKRQVVLGVEARRHLGRERYLAYIACTRAREKLILTWAAQDAAGGPLNPSSLLSHFARLFPTVQAETAPTSVSWKEAEHPVELAETLLRMQNVGNGNRPPVKLESQAGAREEWRGHRTAALAAGLAAVPGLAGLIESFESLSPSPEKEALDPQIAEQLYGPVLKTSVSRMEQFAACPFRFFVHSGLRAEERKLFELDVREQGSFQHEVLALFHEQLREEGKRWRDITPAEARQRVDRLARGRVSQFRDGLLETSEETRFQARMLSESLQDFVETLVDWMRGQYQFEPVEVELGFGEGDKGPAWSLNLGGAKRLELSGRIDRIDVYREPESGRVSCVVVDYKSSVKRLDPVLITHGVQLQLLAYLNVVRQWPDAHAIFGGDHLDPVGVFYVNFRGKYERGKNRAEALSDPVSARKRAYRHSGRFATSALPLLDARIDVQEGDQFNYRLNKDGKVHGGCKEAVGAEEFAALLEQVQENLVSMGRRVYAGCVEVRPYRRGTATACDQCSYRGICRVDPWTHRFLVLRPGVGAGSATLAVEDGENAG